jgi:hypothetical protein
MMNVNQNIEYFMVFCLHLIAIYIDLRISKNLLQILHTWNLQQSNALLPMEAGRVVEPALKLMLAELRLVMSLSKVRVSLVVVSVAEPLAVKLT